MNYFIGLDGGGTKTKCILTCDDSKIIASYIGQATNPLSVGFDESAEILARLLKQAYKKIKRDSSIYICAGIAGCGREFHANKLTCKLKKNLKKLNLAFEDLSIVSDAEIALEGALSGKPGMLLIAGTGSVLIGKDDRGNFYKVGGYGKLIGDEGGGYSIGRKGLNIVSKYYDGRGGESLLAKYLSTKYGINNRDELISKVYSKELNIADIAPLVLRAAKNNDNHCIKLLNEVINELEAHVNSLISNPAFKNSLITFSGSLLAKKNYISTHLKNRLKEKIKIVKAKYPPEMGAIFIAMKMQKILSSKSSREKS
jgi:N-acetylglucosamine kinase-like BadF-type ATPase